MPTGDAALDMRLFAEPVLPVQQRDPAVAGPVVVLETVGEPKDDVLSSA
jgi:hypothetical protein